ncbi:MAG: 30S ribosomal protein S13 [archaeon]
MEEIKGIVRLAEKDINGHLPLPRALYRIKGIGINLATIFSRVIARELQISEDTPLGALSDEQLEKVKDIIYNPTKYGLPEYLLNRRKDLWTGKTEHLLGPALDLRTKQTIDFEKNIKSRRGIRHMLGLSVRGQRTRTTGRKGLTVGVKKKKETPKKAAKSESKK